VTKKESKVWEYLIKNRKADYAIVADECGVDIDFVKNMVSRISSTNWREEIDATRAAERSTILDTAKDLVTTDRAEQHGDAEANFTMIASYWNTHLGLIDFIKVDDIPIMMSLMKIARLHGDGVKNLDNYVDVCGYMSLGGEIAET
tara:strand:- start:683 stop:1120 length:438 start_codon:yes stop_codon:yes gene_type:complete